MSKGESREVSVVSVSKNIFDVKPAEARKRILELHDLVERSYMEIAGLLYRSFTEGWYKEWGFQDWESYVVTEVGYSLRKAQYLMKIFHWCCVEQKDEKLLNKLEEIGWSKAKALTGVVTSNNVDKFVEKAKNLTVEEFEEVVKKTTKKSTPNPEKQEQVTRLTFSLFDDQLKSVEEAIDKAKELGKTDKPGHALSLICLSYLAQNMTDADAKKNFISLIKRFEKAFGYQFLVVEGKKVIFQSKGLGD